MSQVAGTVSTTNGKCLLSVCGEEGVVIRKARRLGVRNGTDCISITWVRENSP